MMKRIGFAALAAACVGVMPLQAQVTPPTSLEFGGLAFNHDIMMSWDFAALSQTQNFGTARSMAMGGAFTSLGADMVSMSLNPAGLGMFQRSEFSVTPLVGLNRAQTPGTYDWSGNSRNRFALANIGAALNIFQSASGALTSVTIGFGMNRIADFNSRTTFSTDYGDHPTLSIADMYALQLQKGTRDPYNPNKWNPIKPDKTGFLPFENPYFWPAVLGYKTEMVNIGKNGRWGRDAVASNAGVDRSVESVNQGSINEFNLSFGANINNFLYVGASLGIQSVYKETELVYGETYGYKDGEVGLDADGQPMLKDITYSDLWQRVKLSGSGVNFKLGVVLRPVAGLRLGVAYHTPTFYSLNRSYQAGIGYQYYFYDTEEYSNNFTKESPRQDSSGSESWQFVSPSRLMFGASYTFGKFAILSVDYERDWYNGIRVKNVPTGVDLGPSDYKLDFKSDFCATNALRAGLELRPLPMLALRVGGGYTSSMLKDQTLAYEMPTATESYYITAGLGVNVSRSVSIDVAYQNLTQKQSDYMLFYSYNVPGERIDQGTDVYNTELTRHFVSLSLGVRF